jgi:exosortase K
MQPRVNKGGYWQSLFWWLPVFMLALILKHHYSIADAEELSWMLQPLSDLLSLITGHQFQREANGEWLSISADVRLVKSCAGINFMLMSLLAYAWTFRPDPNERQQTPAWIGGHLALLGGIGVAAWVTTLIANSLRILLAMALQTDDSILSTLGMEESMVHRFLGLLVYLPLLTLQMLPVKRIGRRQILYIPVVLYGLLMVLVPLLTGNAMRDPGLFLEHVFQLLIGIVLIQGTLYLLLKRKTP